MQRTKRPRRLVRTGAALGALSLLAGIETTSFADNSNPESRQVTAKDTAPAAASKTPTPSYWTGVYWDAQKGSSFWHDTTPKPAIPAAKSPATPNGSSKVRDRHRAAASGKAER